MRGALSLWLRWLHVLGVVTWFGGAIFIAAVLVPLARTFDDPAKRTLLIREAARRFRVVGWVGLSLIVLSGVGNLVLTPWLLSSGLFQVKLALVVLVLALSVVHDFVLGPRATLNPDPSLRVWASWVARVTLLLGLVVIFLGLALRG
jgi:uncharacterized membrane protein